MRSGPIRAAGTLPGRPWGRGAARAGAWRPRGRGGARAGEGGARGAGARGASCGLWRRHPAESGGSSAVLPRLPLATRARGRLGAAPRPGPPCRRRPLVRGARGSRYHVAEAEPGPAGGPSAGAAESGPFPAAVRGGSAAEPLRGGLRRLEGG